MMDRKATQAVEPFVKAGYDLQAEAILELKLRYLNRLQEVEIRGEQNKLQDERANLEKILGSQHEGNRACAVLLLDCQPSMTTLCHGSRIHLRASRAELCASLWPGNLARMPL